MSKPSSPAQQHPFIPKIDCAYEQKQAREMLDKTPLSKNALYHIGIWLASLDSNVALDEMRQYFHDRHKRLCEELEAREAEREKVTA